MLEDFNNEREAEEEEEIGFSQGKKSAVLDLGEESEEVIKGNDADYEDDGYNNDESEDTSFSMYETASEEDFELQY